jgi:fructuronate reductase
MISLQGATAPGAAVGAEMVDDVTPYEHMKLRMLNGTHSALAYLGYLAGHDTIADCMSPTRSFARFVERLWTEEIIPAVEAPGGDAPDLCPRRCTSATTNPAIRHRTWQIAMDGSQKLPQRILGTMAESSPPGGRHPV